MKIPENSMSLFSTPVTNIKGISAKRAAALRRLGINSWYDLITWFPRSYEDWSSMASSDQLEDGNEQTFVGIVAKKPVNSAKGRLTIQKTILKVDQAAVSAVWFNQPWLLQKLILGKEYRFRGRIKRDGRFFSVQSPAFELLEDVDLKASIKPVYPLTEGISQLMLRQWIGNLLPLMIGNMPEPIPDWIRKSYHLCAVDFAYSRIHQPESLEEALICRYRLAFEELFLIQGGLRLLKQQNALRRFAKPIRFDEKNRQKIEQQITGLSYRLTQAQNRTLNEIIADLGRTSPMNRLVQGDVGSGKTVIAAMAMLACALSGGQAAMMAPTAVLAKQHYNSLKSILDGSGFNVELLTGQTGAARKKQILDKLSSGQCSLIVGTHALLESNVEFRNLLLAVTDEQHRFGVRQRSRLSGSEPEDNSADVPHVLVMSATPIPRTLALILYGDLDISVIDEMPPGRQPIETYTANQGDRSRIYSLIRRMVQEGRQAYIVCPVIDNDNGSELTSVTGLYNNLAQDVFPDLKIGLLHGGLKPAVKEAVMSEFYSGHCQVLVSTTVVEVGVDQPNAAIMVIENAERFGLAQLHQLRGRIGRGSHRSICILMSDSKEDLARERLKTLCHSQDGFVIAEKDLELRGPGDFFGTRQHGLPVFKLVNLYEDRKLIQDVSDALDLLFERDPELKDPSHAAVMNVIRQRYGNSFPDLAL
jgi:ATP-dependent DNA helicase RecG